MLAYSWALPVGVCVDVLVRVPVCPSVSQAVGQDPSPEHPLLCLSRQCSFTQCPPVWQDPTFSSSSADVCQENRI